MIDIVILCPIAVEYAAIRAQMNNWSAQKIVKYELSFELSQLKIKQKTWTIALFETGPNIDNLLLKTSRILDSLQPNYAFLVGVAGGIKDVSIGDLVVGTIAYSYEFGKVTSTGFENRAKSIAFSKSLVEEAKQLDREHPSEGYKTVFGSINSGNKVIADLGSEQFKIIREQYGDTVAVEMESYGFAAAALEMREVGFLNIRGISDLIANKSQSDRAGSQQFAAKRAADFTLQLIQRLPKLSNHLGVKKIPVFYTKSPFKTFANRKFQKGTLMITDALCCLENEQESFYFSKIRELTHVKMEGDFAKDWIKIVLPNEQQFYFKEQSLLPGIGSIFGGNKRLFEKMKTFGI